MSVQLSRPHKRMNNRGRSSIGTVLLDRLASALRGDGVCWRWAAGGVWVSSSLVLAICAHGIPSGFGYGFDAVTLVLSGTLGMALAGLAAAALLAMLLPRIRLPRFFAGCLFYFAVQGWVIAGYLKVDLSTRMTIAGALTMATLLPAALAAYFGGARVQLPVKGAAAVAIAAFVLAAVYWPPPGQAPADVPVTATAVIDDAAGGLEDPSQPGPYTVKSFTYGSGSDRHRKAYGDDVALRTEPVDASKLIGKWKPLRTNFWGFDQRSLPLNGRVWMPLEPGKYPLVVMVHGNHLMEQFSDAGYAYIGGLLASRGYIFVSADQNFLNDSVWSGIPDNDMKARAWLLLQHLGQLVRWSGEPGNPFTGAIDPGRIALAGHSRGGQAAAMAADWRRWFAAEDMPDELRGIGIRAVAAIAPTDTKVDGQSALLNDIDYLTVHGARDADVDDFYGDRQYIRTSFTPGSSHFKASLYVRDANHSRFNSDWGPYDQAMPLGLLLNTRDLLSGEESRQIVKVYLSAFLDRSMHGNKRYDGMLQDYRKALPFLPATGYWNRYESAGMHRLAGFDDAAADRSRPAPGLKAAVKGMYQWSIAQATDRSGRQKGTGGLVAAWQKSAVLTLTFSEKPWKTGSGPAGAISFSLANLERDLTPAKGGIVPIPAVTVEAADEDGDAAALPLAAFMPIEPLPRITYTVVPYLERKLGNGRYREPVEPVFQTYMLPLQRFGEAAPGFEAGKLERITFRLGNGPGKLMLDDIGWYRHLEGTQTVVASGEGDSPLRGVASPE